MLSLVKKIIIPAFIFGNFMKLSVYFSCLILTSASFLYAMKKNQSTLRRRGAYHEEHANTEPLKPARLFYGGDVSAPLIYQVGAGIDLEARTVGCLRAYMFYEKVTNEKKDN